MLKFLRKYNKILLVVAGVFLMVAFTAPELIQNLGPNPERRVIAVLDDQRVTEGEIRTHRRQFEAVRIVLPGVIEALGFGDPQTGRISDDHWFLLVQAAERGGFVGEALDGFNWLQSLARREAMQRAQVDGLDQAETESLLNEYLEIIGMNRQRAASRQGLSMDDVDRALAQARGITRMLDAYERANRLADRQIADAAKNLLDTVRVSYVLIPGARIGAGLSEPDEQALLDHFERFRGYTPEQSDYGIGYVRPERVKLEWLTLNREAILNSIEINPVDIGLEYRRNRDRYPGELSEHRDEIRRVLARAEAERIIEEADRVIRGEIRSAVRNLPRENGFRELPSDWDEQRPTLEDIAQAVVRGVKESLDVDIPAPEVVVRAAKWHTRRDLRQLSGISNARIRVGRDFRGIDDVALMVRELAGDNELGLQLGITVVDTPAEDEQGNRYYFTILDARPQSPADTLDEVREQAIEDYRSLRGFEQLREDAPGYTQVAIEEGFEEFVEMIQGDGDDGLPRLRHRRDVRVTRERVGAMERALDVSEFRETVLERAARFDPTEDMQEVPVEERTFHLPLNRSRSVVITRIDGLEPLTQERYRIVAAGVDQLARQRELQEAAPDENPFSFAALARRFNYRVLDTREDIEDLPQEVQDVIDPDADPDA